MIIWDGHNSDTKVNLYYPDYYYDIRGSLSGLSGEYLSIQNNGGDDLVLTSDGGFTFNTPILEGSDYDVSVLKNPQNPVQSCTIINGSGTDIMGDVDNITITCELVDDLIYWNGFENDF